MQYGPCADVGEQGGCEVPHSAGGPLMCPFVSAAERGGLLRYPGDGKTGAPSAVSAPHSAKPLLFTEFPDVGCDSKATRSVAKLLAGHVDAVLFGDTNWNRVQFPPSYRAALLGQEGLAAWPGLNARDRNRVALEGELRALHDIGVAGVHCVTGNHTFSGNRPDAAPVFDLDSTRLTALASSIGLTVSVAASPHTMPTSARPLRTFDKALAGASWCMIDQPGDPSEVAAFIGKVRACGSTTLAFMPVVTIVTSLDDLDRWQQYPNARIPLGWREKLAGASNVADIGRALAVELAKRLLHLDGVSGILLAATGATSAANEIAPLFRETTAELRDATERGKDEIVRS